MHTKRLQAIGFCFFCLIIGWLTISFYLQNQLISLYKKNASPLIVDRNQKELFLKENSKGYQAQYLTEVPNEFATLVLQKEDKYFYYHPGINPFSILKNILQKIGIGERKGSSTLTQQLVKILLEHEQKRNFRNKITELFYALSLETYSSKHEILRMYINSIYFGNKAQGLASASKLHFNSSPELLTSGQTLQLLATLSEPSQLNPLKSQNIETAKALAQNLHIPINDSSFSNTTTVKENLQKNLRPNESSFEIQSLLPNLEKSSITKLTVDEELTQKIRVILKRTIDELKEKNVTNGAVVVIKTPENEILSLVGSADPQSFEQGNQINMLLEPRPIGSTIKPFIYLKAFEKDARPYTLVNDREYKYITALGFPLYPKNFDYRYRGLVTLHYALSNSLNVPTVKVLEYVGLDAFSNFLQGELKFHPVQDIKNYQFGIALGALEMSLFDLATYFTIFPDKGIFKDPQLIVNQNHTSEKQISESRYIQLVNKILSDRKTGIEQFGLKSDLNLIQSNYALKTGTSRDFKDSWVVGYSPDFLVGVWLGNHDNSSMDEISGQIGAGRVWSQVMNVLFNTSFYNKKTPFDFEKIKEFKETENLEYGLQGDDFEKSKNILQEHSIILSPHEGDTFLLEKNTQIILKSSEIVEWFADNKFLEKDIRLLFTPQKTGRIEIEAKTSLGLKETAVIFINQ